MKVKDYAIQGLSYVFRAYLAYVFIPHGWEKLTERINPQEYIDYGLGGAFLDFYLIWETSGFIWVIGAAQLIGGLLLLLKPTTLLGAIWLFPITLGMTACHVFISHALDFLYFDLMLLLFNTYLLVEHYTLLLPVLFNKQGRWI